MWRPVNYWMNLKEILFFYASYMSFSVNIDSLTCYSVVPQIFNCSSDFFQCKF